MTVENLRTPVGRIVWGNPAKAQTKKDQRTKQPVLKDGKPVEQWAFGVAFTKNEFNQFLKPYFDQEAMSAYPNGVPQGFSWKYKDGDGVDRQGKPYSSREGYAGCIVVNISTEAFAPPIYKFVNGAYHQVGPDEIKTGDYVVLSLNLKVNVPTNPSHTPGLYVNPNGIELVGQGEAIMASADPTEMFGGQQYQLPPGAQPIGATPGMPGAPGTVPGQPGQPAQAPQYNPGTMPPAAPQYQPQQPAQPAQAPGYPAQSGQPAQAPQYQPQQPGYPAQQPGTMPPPAHDFVQQPGQPAQAPQYQPQQPGQPAQQAQAPGYPAQPGVMPPR